ncbi:MAG: hypothetical protein K8I02_13570, partial [Candidatus Methylomirabilis sp.]|nr:hypothetical protein [Deltaproteobacteria bacterium]
MHPRRGLPTALLLLAATRPALAAPEDFTNAVNSVQDAADGVDCAWELARSDLERGVGNVGVKVPCVVRVNVSSAGEQSTHGGPNAINPVLSADGRFVAYLSRASNLVAGDTNNSDDIFLYERAAETTTRGSVATAGAQSNGPNLNPW